MSFLKYIGLFIYISILCCSGSSACTCNPPEHEQLKKLLDEYHSTSIPYSQELCSTNLVPVFYEKQDPILAQLSHWQLLGKSVYIQESEYPTPETQEQLLEGCQTYPQVLPGLLIFIDNTPANYTAVYSIFEKARRKGTLYDSDEAEIIEWLMMRGPYFREELIEKARTVGCKRTILRNEEYLEHLLKVDPGPAHKILLELLHNDNPRISTYALTALYELAQGDDAVLIRQQLMHITENEDLPASARNRACDAVLDSQWDGREAWFIHLLCSLGKLSEGAFGYSPLYESTWNDPDRMIPLITPFVGNTNMETHSKAVRCLIPHDKKKSRKANIIPLLPWLDHPDWTDLYSGRRLDLVRCLEFVKLPESIPGLIWILENETDKYLFSSATDALLFQDKQTAIDVLKKVISSMGATGNRSDAITALVNENGFSEQEQADAIAAYFMYIASTDMATEEQFFEQILNSINLDKTATLQEHIGERLTSPRLELNIKTQKMRILLNEKAISLAPHNGLLSRRYLKVVRSWYSEYDALILNNMLRSSSSATFQSLLTSQERYQQDFRELLQELAQDDSRPGASAAVLLGDPSPINRLLIDGSCDTQAWLLGCARLARQEVELSSVTNLFDKGCDSLNLAVDRYLEANGSLEARLALRKLHPDQLLIIGEGRGGFSASNTSSGNEQYIESIFNGKNAPDELFALVGGYGARESIYITIKDGIGRFSISQWGGRFLQRDLSFDETIRLKTFITANHVDLCPALVPGVSDGVAYQYIHTTKDGGCRVYINNPQDALSYAPVYLALVHQFQDLKHSATLSLQYTVEDILDGFEIVIAGNEQAVRTIVGTQDGMCVLLGNRDKGQWYVLQDKIIGAPISEPAQYPLVGAFDDIPDDFSYAEHLNPYPWKSGISDLVIRTARNRKRESGLWRCQKGEIPKRLIDGLFAGPIITPDGNWVIAAKADKGWAKPHTIIQYDLMNHKEHELNLSYADNFDTIAYIYEHKKVLIYHETEGFLLLDPETDNLEQVMGEFDPLLLDHDVMFRQLQPAQETGLYWAAIPGRSGDGTSIGLYDMKTFSFSSVMNVPKLYFESMEMWVDESSQKVYLAINNDLLRFNLKSELEAEPDSE